MSTTAADVSRSAGAPMGSPVGPFVRVRPAKPLKRQGVEPVLVSTIFA
jgi:hypothetical protein